MLTRGKVIQFYIEANIACVSLLNTIFNTTAWNGMVMKSERFIFFHLKCEKHNLPHLKNKLDFIPFKQASNMRVVQMVMMGLIA